jgi:hypothetical protein
MFAHLIFYLFQIHVMYSCVCMYIYFYLPYIYIYTYAHIILILAFLFCDCLIMIWSDSLLIGLHWFCPLVLGRLVRVCRSLQPTPVAEASSNQSPSIAAGSRGIGPWQYSEHDRQATQLAT